jgi:hypothetical protein
VKTSDPAINAPITARFRNPAMCVLLARRDSAPATISRTH